jgi:O-antigen/teichoic acid export membrane protein
MDIFILSRYVSPTTIGEYALILKIATFISFPLTVMSANFAPRIAGFSNQETLKREIVRTGKMILFGAILVFGSLFVLFPFLTNFLHIRNSAGLPVFLLIGTGYLVSSFFSLNETCLVMLGEEKRYQKIMIFACVINLILNLLLIPVLKETGAATASMLTLIIWNVAAAYYTNKKLRLPTGITF